MEETASLDGVKESQPSSPATEEGSQTDSKMDDRSDVDEKVPVANISSKVEREGNCYCGKERNLNIVELLCASCNRWYHESCIGYQLGKLVPFMMNYVFICKNCSNTGLESFKKNPPGFPQICVTAMANLMQTSVKSGNARTKFSKDKDIFPFIEQHWDALTTFARRVKQSMQSSVVRALTKETNITFLYEESPEEGPLYSLCQQDLTQIKPNYEAMIKQGASGGNLRRSTKRKIPDPGTVGSKKSRGGDVALPKLPAHGYPMEHPFNKDGYRYYLAEPDPHAPFRQEFDESSDWAGKPIPGWLYRTLIPGTVLLALHDRAPQLRISEDRLSVTGEKGYCMVRSTHAVSRGSWYFEVSVDDMKDGSAARLGWAQEYANLQAPLGYDKFGYAWRSRKGTRFHESRGKHYSSGFGEGDVLGFLIVLPNDPSNAYIPNTYKDKPLVKFKSHLYYEEKDRVAESLKRLTILPSSKIYFFKNGVCQGEAFEDVFAGAYFPAVSLHKNATVTINYGPRFKHPPPKDQFTYNGMHMKAEEAICEQTMADLMYLTENDGKLRLDTYSV